MREDINVKITCFKVCIEKSSRPTVNGRTTGSGKWKPLYKFISTVLVLPWTMDLSESPELHRPTSHYARNIDKTDSLLIALH